jgi:orotate phosphoribosyltransferase
MKSVDDLTESAKELADQGLSRGEIADELNVSRETASWLVERGGGATADEPVADAGTATTDPTDIHIDWNTVGRDSYRLAAVGAAMADLLSKQGQDVDLTIGIEKAGVPLATTIARELDTDLGTYTPRKHQWDEGDIEDLGGSFSRNFASIRGRECYLVDDTITSGTTMTETVEAVRNEGGEPVACCVLADKQGVEECEGVPVYSLLQVIQLSRGEE